MRYLIKKLFYFTKIDFLLVSLILINFLFHETPYNLIVSIPQIIIVGLFAIKGNYNKAFLYHIIFTLTCSAIPSSQIAEPGEYLYTLSNYSKLKIYGPISFSSILFIIIFLSVLVNKNKIKYKLPGNNLLDINNFLIITFILGSLIGFINLFFDNNLNGFRDGIVYVGTLIGYILIAINLEGNYARKIILLILKIILLSPIVIYILWLLGQGVDYGEDMTTLYFEPLLYWPLLLLCIIYYKSNIYFIISLISFIGILFLGGLGGKIFLILLFYIILLVCVLIRYNSNFYKLFYFFIIFSFFLISLFIFNFESNLFSHKINSFRSLMYLDQDLVESSPLIRIYEIFLIYHKYSSNIISLLFGNGFGSTYTDSLGLFNFLDMKNAFSYDEIASGIFYHAHDSIPSVFLFGGLVGLIYLIIVSLYYFKLSFNNILYSSFFPFLFVSFYFNYQFATIGCLLISLCFYYED
jgi:hypothetical protein